MSRWQTLKRLLGMVQRLWGVMVVSMIMRGLNYGSGIAILYIGARGISRAFFNPQQFDFSSFIWCLIAVGIMKGVFRYLEHFTGHYVAFHLLAILRNHLYKGIEPLAPAGLIDKSSGDVISRVNGDVERIEVFYAHTIAPLINAVIVPTICLIVIGSYAIQFVWVILPFLFIVGVLSPYLADRMAKRYSFDLRKLVGKVSEHLTDSIQGLREILAFGGEERRRREIFDLGNRLSNFQKKISYASGLQIAISELAIAGGIFSVLFMGIRLVNTGMIAIVDLPPMLALATMIFGPVIATNSVLHDFNQAMASAARLFALIDQPPLIKNRTLKTLPVPFEPTIHFENVYFKYPHTNVYDNNDKNVQPFVLRSLEFDIPSGSTVALVGPSGAGKSTITQLVLRFWDVNDGCITMGDVDIRDLCLEELRKQISVVSQQTCIFNATIFENIRLGKPEASMSEIEEAVRMARLDEFINSLPMKYETVVGEMGSKISGGQRQRIAIARAFLKSAPILILDEPTSNLDTKTENAIQQEIEKLRSDCTTLIIAHRLLTIIDADEILVIDKGQIVERGGHSELIEENGVYARLFSYQQLGIQM